MTILSISYGDIILECALSLVMLSMALVMLARMWRLRFNGIKTMGRVTHVEYEEDVLDDEKPFPVIAYTTTTGQQFTERYSKKSTLFKPGDVILVYYDPQRPEKFIIYDFAAFLFPVLLLLGGVFFLYPVLFSH